MRVNVPGNNTKSMGDDSKTSTFLNSLSIPFEHPVTSLSISPMGSEAVLAAKRGLYIINLENPFEPPKILHHLSKWDVADCAWNPHPSRKEWIVTTSNTKALIWNVHRESASSKSHVEFVLNKHLRAISDIHWSPFHPELVATCSYDAYVHLWDLRANPEKPANSFCGWNAGATQVKFNRVNEYLVASSHDTDVRIWDTRKGSSPITLITAHRTKIYGLDWSRSVEDELLTCSQDTLVKIWNIKTPRNCRATIETSSPCWRARYTPFGNGILTMPQRKDNNLYLWNLDRLEAPAYIFAGHVDTPTEFVWRFQDASPSGADFSQEYQLVTWSKDMHLRLWPIGKEIAASAGVDVEDETPRTAEFPSSSSPRSIKPRRNYSDSHLHASGVSSGSDPDNSFNADTASIGSNKSSALSRSRDSASDEESIIIDNDLADIEMELNNVQVMFSSIYIDRSNLGSRRCTIRLERIDPVSASSKQSSKPILFQVNISFPKGYPKVPLFCDIQRNWSISMMNRNFLSRKLGLISVSFAKRNNPCLEFIVKYLLGGNNSTDSTTDALNKSSSPLSMPLIHKSEVAAAATVGGDSDSDSSSGLDDIILPPKAFTADRAPAGLVDESDDSFSDESIVVGGGGGGVIGIGIGGMAMGRHLDSTAHEKGSNSVPFPRLCSATFSPTGQLIYFISPLPHPSNSKFTAYTLTTRNQQPILQSQNFSAQPKTYQLYESYRNFVLSKVPKNRFLGVSSNITDLIPKDGNLRDRKLDYWLDDEDMDDDSLSLYWRPKPTTTMQPQSLQTTDFLARIVSFRAAAASSVATNPVTMATKNSRAEDSPGLGSGNLKDHPIHTTLSAFAEPLLQNHGGLASVSLSDVSATEDQPAKRTGIRTRRKSSSIVPDPAPTWVLGNPPARSLETRHKKMRSEGAEAVYVVPPAAAPVSVTPVPETTFGTVVFCQDLSGLCGPDVRVARGYCINGNGGDVCRENMGVACAANRSDLALFWRVGELMCGGGEAVCVVLEEALQVLAERKDVQTLATLLAVCGNSVIHPKEDNSDQEGKHCFMPNFLTSSPAMAAINRHLQVIPGPTERNRERASRLCKSLKVPFSARRPSSTNRQTLSLSAMRNSSLQRLSSSSTKQPPSTQAQGLSPSIMQRSFSSGLQRSASSVIEEYAAGHSQAVVEEAAVCRGSSTSPSYEGVERRIQELMKKYRAQIYLYSTYLYDCGLFDKRIQLLKTSWKFDAASLIEEPRKCTSFQLERGGGDGGDGGDGRGVLCLYCRCRVRGLSSFCVFCKHGGHTSCMKRVFDGGSSEVVGCLSGCGCHSCREGFSMVD